MYIRNDQVLEAVRNARVPAIFEGTRLRAYGSAVNSHSVCGFTSAQITRCGQPLSDALREVLAEALTAAIQHKGPPAGFYVAIHGCNRIFDCGAGLGNWVRVRARKGGGKAAADAITLGIISDLSWKGPDLRMLGFDDETGVVYYEYAGETRDC